MSSSIELTRGDDELINFVVRDPNGVGAEVDDYSTWPLVDLTGCSLWFYIKSSSNLADAEALVAKGPTDVVVDPDQSANKGEASVALVPADTASIDRSYLDRQLHYEVQLKDASDKISTVARGRVIIAADFVRTTT